MYSNKKTKKREPVFEDGMDGRNDERGFCLCSWARTRVQSLAAWGGGHQNTNTKCALSDKGLKAPVLAIAFHV